MYYYIYYYIILHFITLYHIVLYYLILFRLRLHPIHRTRSGKSRRWLFLPNNKTTEAESRRTARTASRLKPGVIDPAWISRTLTGVQ